MFKILQLLLLDRSFDYKREKIKFVNIGKISRSALIQFPSSSKRANKFRDSERIGNRDRLPVEREGRLIFLILSYEAIEWLVAPARIF